jgi:microcystin-dependent protein
MSDPFLGQVIMFGGNFAPRGWAFCEGQLLSIAQNSALFSILGTTYGGDGRTTFALPDLRGRVPMGSGNGPGLTPRKLGTKTGSETNTLTVGQMPAHSHAVAAQVNNDSAATTDPANHFLAPAESYATAGTAGANLGGVTCGNTGGNQPVNNIQPVLVINYIIALVGIFPSRN